MDFLAITGPTTSGKTALSMELAPALDAEIICMDSRQIYRGMNIGTDKVSKELRSSVTHHGVDTKNPDETYSAGQFGRDARIWISDIQARAHVPMLVGGTGFFLRALIDPMFSQPHMDEHRLKNLRRNIMSFPVSKLRRWVERLDPDRARIAVEGGPHRLGRTLEIALLTGHPLSWWHKKGEISEGPLRGMIVVLEIPREELDRRINIRVTRMVENGLIDEVKRLLEQGYSCDDPGMTGTSYREISAYLKGVTSLEEAIDQIRSVTRRYARRQLTWFRHQVPENDVVRIDGLLSLESQAEKVVKSWNIIADRKRIEL